MNHSYKWLSYIWSIQLETEERMVNKENINHLKDKRFLFILASTLTKGIIVSLGTEAQTGLQGCKGFRCVRGFSRFNEVVEGYYLPGI